MSRLQKTFTRIFIALALGAGLASCGGGGGGEDGGTAGVGIDPSTIRFKQHFDAKNKILVAYPESWQRQVPYDEPVPAAIFREPLRASSDRFSETVFLLKVGSVDEITGPEIINTRPISNQTYSVAGELAQEQIFDAKLVGVQGVDLRFMQIHFEIDGAIYALMYVGERKDFNRNVSVVRYMASKIRVGQSIFEDLETSSLFESPGKPAIASDGQDFLIVSCRKDDAWPYPQSLIGRIFRSDRSLEAEFVIQPPTDGIGCNYAGYEAIFDGQNYLVTYAGDLANKQHVLGRRISTDGILLDADPIDISRNTSTSVSWPTLAFDGSRTLVVWSEYDAETSQIRGAFVGPLLSLSATFVIESDLDSVYSRNGRVSPKVAYGNSQYLVIWNTRFSLDVRKEPMPIYGQVISLSGDRLLPGSFKIRSDNGDNPRYLQVVFDGSDYLVSWIEGLLHTNFTGSGSFTIYARPISQSGDLLDGDADTLGKIIVPPVRQTNSTEQLPKDFLKLSYADGSFFFLWSSLVYTPEGAIYGVRASKDLNTISSRAPLAGTTGDIGNDFYWAPAQPNLAFSDNRSLAVWPSRDGVLEGWLMDEIGY